MADFAPEALERLPPNIALAYAGTPNQLLPLSQRRAHAAAKVVSDIMRAKAKGRMRLSWDISAYSIGPFAALPRRPCLIIVITPAIRRPWSAGRHPSREIRRDVVLAVKVPAALDAVQSRGGGLFFGRPFIDATNIDELESSRPWDRYGDRRAFLFTVE